MNSAPLLEDLFLGWGFLFLVEMFHKFWFYFADVAFKVVGRLILFADWKESLSSRVEY